MPPKTRFPPQKNTLFGYLSKTPSQAGQNAVLAPSPVIPSTIQETPTPIDVATTLDSDSSLSSRSPSPSAPPDLATYDGTTETRGSSLPQSSGQSSKRTFSQGHPVVLNSDSDSDSLSDLEDRFKKHQDKPKPVMSAAATRRSEESKDYVLPQPPQRRNDDTAFRRLVQAAQENAEKERQIAEAQAELDKSLQEDLPKRDLKISEEMVAGAVKDENDPEKAKKLYLAMQRTHALHVDCFFHFFDHDSDHRTPTSSHFPTNCLPQYKLASIFKEPVSRYEAFLSGFAQRVFQRQLPEELAMWMIDEVCISNSEALSGRYIQLLGLHKHLLERILDASKLQTIFNSLGANTQYLNTTSEWEITPSYGLDPGTRRPLPASLINVCKLLQLAASGLCTKTRVHLLQVLSLVSMDDRVQVDNAVLHAVQDTIESLVRTTTGNGGLTSVLNTLVSNLLTRVNHPILQQNLVRALPTRTPLTASLQRYLALSFLLYPAPTTHPPGTPSALAQLRTLLQTSPKFRTTKDTDYACLAAHFSLLDITLGPGPLPVPYQPMLSPPASQLQEPLDASLVASLTPPPDEVRTFNKEVDALARQIRLLGNGIGVAGGITELTRLAANDCCERVCTRLENAVRIGGRKVRSVFGADEESERGRATFGKWLKRGTEERGTDGSVVKRVAVERGDREREEGARRGRGL